MSEDSTIATTKFDARIMKVSSLALNQDAKKLYHDFNLALFQAVRKHLCHIKETGDFLQLTYKLEVEPIEALVCGSYPCDLNAPVDGETWTENKNFDLALNNSKL